MLPTDGSGRWEPGSVLLGNARRGRHVRVSNNGRALHEFYRDRRLSPLVVQTGTTELTADQGRSLVRAVKAARADLAEMPHCNLKGLQVRIAGYDGRPRATAIARCADTGTLGRAEVGAYANDADSLVDAAIVALLRLTDVVRDPDRPSAASLAAAADLVNARR